MVRKQRGPSIVVAVQVCAYGQKVLEDKLGDFHLAVVQRPVEWTYDNAVNFDAAEPLGAVLARRSDNGRMHGVGLATDQGIRDGIAADIESPCNAVGSTPPYQFPRLLRALSPLVAEQLLQHRKQGGAKRL